MHIGNTQCCPVFRSSTAHSLSQWNAHARSFALKRSQYQFVAAPRQVWVVPPQALTTELSSFGVRTIDVNADDDLFVPGYEYHFMDDFEDAPQLYSQIPPRFAGGISEVDPARADASPWNERLAVLKDFRKAIGHPRPEGAS